MPAQEKTELEEQRRALQEEVVRYRAKIKQLENDLLFRLSNSQARLPCAPMVRSPAHVAGTARQGLHCPSNALSQGSAGHAH